MADLDTSAKRNSALLDPGNLPWPPDGTIVINDRLVMLELYFGLTVFSGFAVDVVYWRGEAEPTVAWSGEAEPTPTWLGQAEPSVSFTGEADPTPAWRGDAETTVTFRGET